MPDDPGTTPERSLPFRGGGPAAILSFKVAGPRNAVVAVAVQHRDSGDPVWSNAGSLSVSAPAVAALRVSCLKEELRLRLAVIGGSEGDPVDVRVLPPEWHPC